VHSITFVRSRFSDVMQVENLSIELIPFGVLKEYMGSESIVIPWNSDSTVEDIFRWVHLNFILPEGLPIRFAINSKYCTMIDSVPIGSIVLIMPPVSGG